MNTYKVLNKQIFHSGNYSLVPIRIEDRFDIMKWRNEQMYHLRQTKPLNEETQNSYFQTVISVLFHQDRPEQVLFSLLENENCIGYGGLVHINWIDKNAEISFLMNTDLEKDKFEELWVTFLKMIETVAREELGLFKIYTYAYDLRPKLYLALEKSGYLKEGVLKNHVCINNKYVDVLIHFKTFDNLLLRKAKPFDTEITYKWASDPEVRKFSFNKEKIEYEKHKKWFENKLKNTNCAYYILSEKGLGIGSIRFDIENENTAMISYLIDPGYHGKGFGKLILELGMDKIKADRPEIDRIYGLVQPENIASVKIFEKLEFVQTSGDISTLRFEKFIKK